jgi:two-component system, chemotaxis family, protein-glutamate methylesterase/glutaminase
MPTSRAGKTIRVLVAEDSPTARMLLVELLRSAKDFEVVGEAANGAEAIERAVELSPDLIIMDVHMPILNGLDATKEIMRQAPAPILMVSAAASSNDVALALSATQAGALMILEKPHNPSDPDFAGEAEQLLTMARAMAGVKVVRRWGGSRQPAAIATRARAAANRAVKLIAIGTSTGGPAALHRIFIDLERDFPVPIVVVQHMAHGFIGGLASWLGANTSLKVTVAEQNEPLVGGTIYLAPDDAHLGVTPDGRAALSHSAPLNGFRPSADHLFDSSARAYGSSLVAVILTGMGSDGADGLATVKARHGRIIAQDERSSVIFGMNQQAIERGLADEVLPLDTIGRRLAELTDAGKEGGGSP